MCVHVIWGRRIGRWRWEKCSLTRPCMAHEVGKGMGCRETDTSSYRFKDSFLAAAREAGESTWKRAALPFVLTSPAWPWTGLLVSKPQCFHLQNGDGVTPSLPCPCCWRIRGSAYELPVAQSECSNGRVHPYLSFSPSARSSADSDLGTLLLLHPLPQAWSLGVAEAARILPTLPCPFHLSGSPSELQTARTCVYSCSCQNLLHQTGSLGESVSFPPPTLETVQPRWPMRIPASTPPPWALGWVDACSMMNTRVPQ